MRPIMAAYARCKRKNELQIAIRSAGGTKDEHTHGRNRP